MFWRRASFWCFIFSSSLAKTSGLNGSLYRIMKGSVRRIYTGLSFFESGGRTWVLLPSHGSRVNSSGDGSRGHFSSRRWSRRCQWRRFSGVLRCRARCGESRCFSCQARSSTGGWGRGTGGFRKILLAIRTGIAMLPSVC